MSPSPSTTAATHHSPIQALPRSMDEMTIRQGHSYAATPKQAFAAPSAAADDTQTDDTSEEDEHESDDTDGASFPINKRPSSQSLTKESLMLFNLKHSSKPLAAHTGAASSNASNFTTTPELTSSSSVTSFDENSEDSKAIHRLYNNSNSSIATIVQRISSSTSTLNLQSDKHADDAPSDADKSAIPKSNPFIDRITANLSSTSLSSLTDHNEDTAGTTTDANSVKAPKRLKSSLKLPGLTRCNSMPASKSVRFSAELEKVKTFNEYAKPSSISLDNSPEQSPPSSQDYDYEYGAPPKAFFELNSANFYTNTSSDSDDSEEDYFTYKNKMRVSKWKMMAQNFDLLSNFRPFALPPVKLSSLSIADNKLKGTVEVMNFSFEKYVEVKFTTDSWNSIYLVTGSYARSLDSNKDQFKFEIDLNKSIMMNSSRMLKKNSTTPIKVELCVKYIAGGSSVYYDNNNSLNYRFELVNQACENRKQRKQSSSQHHSNTHTRSNSIDGNFLTVKVNAPPKVMSSGRYFSEDTDFFNHSPNKMKWQNNNFESSFATASSSSASSLLSTAKTSSNSSSDTLTKSSSRSTATVKPPSTAQPQSYSDFLQKYCFFKSDDPKNLDTHESVFIR